MIQNNQQQYQIGDLENDQFIRSLYHEILGRPPEDAGLEWWKANAPAMLAQGGEAKVRDAFTGAIYADARKSPAHEQEANFLKVKQAIPYATHLTQPQQRDWSAYMTQAAQEQRGMNNMPGVFNQYAELGGATPEQAKALMYATPEQQQKRVADTNALWSLVGGLGATPAAGTTAATSATTKKTPEEDEAAQINMINSVR